MLPSGGFNLAWGRQTLSTVARSLGILDFFSGSPEVSVKKGGKARFADAPIASMRAKVLQISVVSYEVNS
jgi:hypothetical protein